MVKLHDASDPSLGPIVLALRPYLQVRLHCIYAGVVSNVAGEDGFLLCLVAFAGDLYPLPAGPTPRQCLPRGHQDTAAAVTY